MTGISRVWRAWRDGDTHSECEIERLRPVRRLVSPGSEERDVTVTHIVSARLKDWDLWDDWYLQGLKSMTWRWHAILYSESCVTSSLSHLHQPIATKAQTSHRSFHLVKLLIEPVLRTHITMVKRRINNTDTKSNWSAQKSLRYIHQLK